MPLTAVQKARVKAAAAALCRSGNQSDELAKLTYGETSWAGETEYRVLVILRENRNALAKMGVDVGLLPSPDSGPGFVTGRTVKEDQAQTQDWSIPETAGARTSAEVVATPSTHGGPLQFDCTLDGLRGVPVSELDGVGERTNEKLKSAGVENVYDLLMRVPLRYVDRTHLTELAMLRPGMEKATFISRVKRVDTNWEKRYVRLMLGDNTVTIAAYYHRQMWMRNAFRAGDIVITQGNVEEFNGKLKIVDQLVEGLEDSSAPLMAIYPQSAKHRVDTWMLRRAAKDALRRIPRLDDPIPGELVSKRRQPTRLEALRAIHLPDNHASASQGRDRIAYDELLRLQLALGVLRNAQKESKGIVHQPDQTLTARWIAQLPWPLTGAQRRALNEVHADLQSAAPMSRLLQGDVGSGKTAVLAGSALMVIESTYQVALLAPTEILARQHYEELEETLTPLGVRVDLLVSKNLPRKRKDVLAAISDGSSDLVIGTVALLSDKVKYKRLGLALIDEQHRFGVDQRALLSAKGADGVAPDVLQATATPIPRTSSMTTFGDLDVSILDEKPAGRSPIRTSWVDGQVSTSNPNDEPWRAIRDEVSRGRQAFVVCPRVVVSGKESETKQAAAAVETAQELAQGALSGLRVGVATGKQHPTERAAEMQAFKNKELDVLVATTVIEVGVSIPNATVVVILDATSFGLAQLHQLRGRVGRSSLAGQCWLVAEPAGSDGVNRMEAMCSTDDGFELANRDLAIRGPGSLSGQVQAGRESSLFVADLVEDEQIHLAARADAQQILAADPTLLRNRTLKTEVELQLGDDSHYLTKG